ncbi:MAG: MraY family glycosyltransferase [Bryobacteraceae bacterium]|nr:MraY family glycosyltransferase [Bryobacteraceae bacterium]
MYLIITLGFVSFVMSLILTPIVRDAFLKRGLVDKPDNVRKLHQAAVPRIGGIAIMVSYALSFVIGLVLPFSYSQTLHEVQAGVWKLCLAAGLIFLTGLLDDLKVLNPWEKLGEQLVAALMAYSAGVQIHIAPGESWDIWVSLPVSIIWIIGCTNAFNLIDGLDGLAAGVGLFATITVLIAALAHNNVQLALVTVPLAGALLGFLRYNFNPASVFLGDSGSLTIGFLLGCYGVLWSQKSATILGMVAPLISLSIPLLDVALSIVRRFLRHKPLFEGDRGHIHHRLLDRGLTPRRAALLIYGLTGIAAAVSLIEDMSHHEMRGVLVIVFCVATWIGIQHLGYTEFGIARRLFVRGGFRRIIDSQARLQSFEKEIAGAATLEECWQAITRASSAFCFDGVRMRIGLRTFEQTWAADDGGVRWQVRVPLPDQQYINFQWNFGGEELSVAVLNGFVNCVQRALSEKLAQPGFGVAGETAPATESLAAAFTESRSVQPTEAN